MKKFISPNNFCVFPAIGYWELNGKPVSAKEAEYGLKKGAIWKETEIGKNIDQYMGKIIES